MTLQYDTPTEVTEKQYKAVMANCEGICAGKEENGKFYIKIWLMKYSNYVQKFLK